MNLSQLEQIVKTSYQGADAQGLNALSDAETKGTEEIKTAVRSLRGRKQRAVGISMLNPAVMAVWF